MFPQIFSTMFLAATCLCGEAPERANDFFWENDRVGFRAYGPGDVHKWSGIDVFNKSCASNIVVHWLREPKVHGNWHLNRGGLGMDNYAVGPGRGVGGVAFRKNGEWLPDYGNWTKYRVLTNCEQRCAFELDYSLPFGGTMTLAVSLDRAHSLFREAVSFSPDTPLDGIEVGVGLDLNANRLHTGDVYIDEEKGIVSLFEKPHVDKNGNPIVGEEGSAMSAVRALSGYSKIVDEPNGAKMLMTRPLRASDANGRPVLEVYAGADWSEAGRFTAPASWHDYVKSFGLEVLLKNYVREICSSRDAGKAAEIRAAMKDDGSWGDINYANQVRSEWPLGKHFGVYLTALAADWCLNRNEESLRCARKALAFWFERRFICSNWWWNIIGIPQRLGDVALMLDDALTADERRQVLEIMTVKEPSFASTGQNFAWMSENRIRRGLIARDGALVRTAVDDVLREVKMGDVEGIRDDWCFHQHGAQPQFGNYGLSFICNQSRLVLILSGTEFAYPEDKLELLRNLVSEGYTWVCWKGMMDVSAMGRQLHFNAQRKKCAAINGAMSNLMRSGWNPPSERRGFRYFNRSAYAVYRTASWMASIRASTPKIIGTETWINEDNVKGMCMADGALMMYSSGCEYENVFPLWDDWRMIPGVTAYLGKPLHRKDSRNERDDISVVDDARASSFEFTFAREGLVAHKKWSFDEKGVKCEGSGITATNGEWKVVTCVEHSLAADNAGVVYSRDDESCFRNGDFMYVVHAPRGEIVFEVAERSGNVRDYMCSSPSTPRTGKVFSLRIVHGVKPVDASYRYEILFNGK